MEKAVTTMYMIFFQAEQNTFYHHDDFKKSSLFKGDYCSSCWTNTVCAINCGSNLNIKQYFQLY